MAAAAVSWNRFGQAAGALPAAPAPAPALTVAEKLALMGRNLQEVCKPEILRHVLEAEGRDVRIYWGTATTGRPHVAYFVPLSKMADFLHAGCEVTILFADVHAALDNLKASWEQVKFRTQYYEHIIRAVLESIGVPLDKLRFVVGSEFQLTPAYTLDLLKLTTLTSQHDAQRAGAEVVKQTTSPPLSGLLYPLLQWLDEQYLGCDAQFGGVDQRKIFVGAQDYLPKIGYKARAHLMNPMVPGLSQEKMSSSDPKSKIDLLDSPEDLKKKIKGVFCEEGNIEKNPLLSFVKNVLLLVRSSFVLQPREGEPIVYTDYAVLEAAFAAKQIHPADFKSSVVTALNQLLEPIRAKFQTPEMLQLIANAYPDECKPEAKASKAAAAAAAAPAAPAAPAAAAEAKSVKEKATVAAVAGGGAPSEEANAAVDIARVDMRVGKIVKIEKHPDADSLYVEQIDVGEQQPRTVVSGLANKIPMAELQDALVVVVCNLKPANMRGVKSEAMLMAASSDDGSKTEILLPPSGSAPGDRVTVAKFPGTPDAPFMNPKKKIWETVQPELLTNADRVAVYKGEPFTTAKGAVTVATLVQAHIK